MITFLKTPDPDNEADQGTVRFELSNESDLTEMLTNFEQFLYACGYRFDGELDFVEEEKDAI